MQSRFIVYRLGTTPSIDSEQFSLLCQKHTWLLHRLFRYKAITQYQEYSHACMSAKMNTVPREKRSFTEPETVSQIFYKELLRSWISEWKRSIFCALSLNVISLRFTDSFVIYCHLYLCCQQTGPWIKFPVHTPRCRLPLWHQRNPQSLRVMPL